MYGISIVVSIAGCCLNLSINEIALSTSLRSVSSQRRFFEVWEFRYAPKQRLGARRKESVVIENLLVMLKCFYSASTPCPPVVKVLNKTISERRVHMDGM